MMLPAAMLMAKKMTEEHLGSALPGAPVVPERVQRARPARLAGLRRATAVGLRGLATRVEPRPDTCQPAM
jgi:hypothetical protein